MYEVTFILRQPHKFYYIKHPPKGDVLYSKYTAREGKLKETLSTFSSKIRFWYHFEAGFALNLPVPLHLGNISEK